MKKMLASANLVTYIIVVIVNLLAISLPFFGHTPGDISDMYNDPLTPADFTFKIWSVIYVLLGFYIYRQSQLFRPTSDLPPEVSLIGWLFVGTCICNVSWLLLWQSQHIALAFAAIFILWILLIVISYRLTMHGSVHWMTYIPFSVYLSWVSIATLANLNILFLEWGYDFFGYEPETWTMYLVLLGVAGGLLVLYLYQNVWFLLVLAWGLFGIYIKNSSVDHLLPQVTLTAIGAVLIMVVIGWRIGGRKMKV